MVVGSTMVESTDQIYKCRFESCPDYYGLVTTIQRIEEVGFSQVAELGDANATRRDYRNVKPPC